ncbi:hypothetical protein ACJX0J_031787, partial [Zea mays]
YQTPSANTTCGKSCYKLTDLMTKNWGIGFSWTTVLVVSYVRLIEDVVVYVILMQHTSDCEKKRHHHVEAPKCHKKTQET